MSYSPLSILDLLEQCHPIDGVFTRNTGNYCLVYLSIPNLYDNPEDHIWNVGKRVRPKTMKMTIGRIGGIEAYNMVVSLSYIQRIKIHTCKFFELFRVTPYIVTAPSQQVYDALSHHIIRVNSVPRLPHQPIIKGEIPIDPAIYEYQPVQVDSDMESVHESDSTNSDSSNSESYTSDDCDQEPKRENAHLRLPYTQLLDDDTINNMNDNRRDNYGTIDSSSVILSDTNDLDQSLIGRLSQLSTVDNINPLINMSSVEMNELPSSNANMIINKPRSLSMMPKPVRRPHDSTINKFSSSGVVIPGKKLKKQFDKTRENNDMRPRENFHLEICNTMEQSKGKHIILYGRIGIGKTSFAKFRLNYNCLIVEDLDIDLQRFDSSIHKSILFENVDFSNMGLSNVLHLVCGSKRIYCYDDVEIKIPPTTQLIFTTSIEGGRIFGNGMRRAYKSCKIVKVSKEPYYIDDSSSSEEVDMVEAEMPDSDLDK